MAKLIKQSDFAIVTPSVTVNEVIFMDLPFIAIMTADNQIDIYEYLVNNGYITLEEFNSKVLKNKIIEFFKPELINFIDLSLEEKKMILKWRNHSSIRKWMYSKEMIALDDHLNYIKTLSDKKDRLYFLVRYKNEAIGVIDFTDIDYDNSRSYFGLYAKPNSRGFGKILLSSIIDYAFNNLKIELLVAEVFEHNQSAINLYKKFNFKEKTRRENIIVMELKNENR
jgi:UDP-4-amino-4,6-dideoxy-N-acetyl-beta-L-altrosamine N-acetyltransferase